MAIGGAEGIGISYYGNQIFLIQFLLKIIDRNQTEMLSDLRKQNIFSYYHILLSYFGNNYYTELKKYLTAASHIVPHIQALTELQIICSKTFDK